MIKRILPILLAVLLLFAGAAAADTISLDVTVIDADTGNPVDGAVISLFDQTTQTDLSSGTTDSLGKYRKNALESADTYEMSITKDGYLSYTRTLTIPSNVTVTYPCTAELKTNQEPIYFHIMNTSGVGVPEATVTINKGTKKEVSGKTDATGTVRLGLQRGVSNEITITSDEYYNKTLPVTIASGENDYTVIVDRATVSAIITVYNEGNTTISGARVYLNGEFIGVTNERGKCTVPDGTDAGKHILMVNADGYSVYSKEIALTANTHDFEVVVSYLSSSVNINVVTTDGKPIDKAQVYFDGKLTGQTNVDGVFSTTASPGDKIYVSASVDGYSGDAKTLEVAVGTNTVVIEMKQNIPYVLIGIGALAVIIVLLIIILIVTGKRRGGKGRENSRSYTPPTTRRDSL